MADAELTNLALFRSMYLESFILSSGVRTTITLYGCAFTDDGARYT